jgi:hypothetical protein
VTDYRARRLRRRVPKAPMRSPTRNTTIPMNSRYSRPSHDAQHDRHDYQEQDEGKHSIPRSVCCSAAGQAPLTGFPALC